MDVSGSTTKLSNISSKINDYKEKISSVYNKYAIVINKYIDEFYEVVNKLKEKCTTAVNWTKMQIKKILKKISDAVKTLKQKISDLMSQITEWYNKTVNSFKISAIKSVKSKMGESCDDKAAEALTSILPSPSVDALLPKINIDLEVPENVDLETAGDLELKKLPML